MSVFCSGHREEVDSNVYSIYDGYLDSLTSKKEGRGTLKLYNKQNNVLISEYEGWFHKNLKHGFGETKEQCFHSVGAYENDLLKGYGTVKYLVDCDVHTAQGVVRCMKDEVFVGIFANNCPFQGLWYRASKPVVTLHPLSFYRPDYKFDLEHSNIMYNFLFNINMPSYIMHGSVQCAVVSKKEYNANMDIEYITFFPKFLNNAACKGRIVTYKESQRRTVKSVYDGDLKMDAANPATLPKREGFGRLIQYADNTSDIEIECIGKWTNDTLTLGTYKSVRSHKRGEQQWSGGTEYTGEFGNDFMMQGKGELIIECASKGDKLVDKGTFVAHRLDTSSDYTILKSKYDIVHAMETKCGNTTYSGGVQTVQDPVHGTVSYIRHGTGIYESDLYRYTGHWSNGVREGRGIFECKQTDIRYFPFEVGDVYEGDFVLQVDQTGKPYSVATGAVSRWENPGKFKFSGVMMNNCPVSGRYESLSDHFRHDTRGMAVNWKRGWTYNGHLENFRMHGQGTLVKQEAGGTVSEQGSFLNHLLCKDESQNYCIETQQMTGELCVTLQFARDGVTAKYVGDVMYHPNANIVTTGQGKLFKNHHLLGHRVETGTYSNPNLDPLLDRQQDYSIHIYDHDVPYKLMETGVCVHPPSHNLPDKFVVKLERKNGNKTVHGHVVLKYVRILHISDTQNLHSKLTALPDADILVHTGDFTKNGTQKEYDDFNRWLQTVKSRYQHRVVIPGDRDYDTIFTANNTICATPSNPEGLKNLMNRLLPNATVLMHEAKEIVVNNNTILRFYGSPWCRGHDVARPGDTPACRDVLTELVQRFDEIPANVDVLLTHCAPYEILDDATDYTILPVNTSPVRWGSSRRLLNAVMTRRPKLHLFGHVIEQNGYWVKTEDGSYSNDVCGSEVNPPVTSYPCALMSNNAMINKRGDAIVGNARLILLPAKASYGEGTLTECNGDTVITYTGTFTTDRFESQDLDRTKDFRVLTTRNNVVVRLETRVGDSTYEGDVVSDGNKPGNHLKHGQGTLDTINYRYTGAWHKDTRHGSGIFECKQTTTAYFPFEAGDLYEGEFNMRVAEGNCVRWERPNVFLFSGTLKGNCPVTGVYESFCDHTRGNGTEWKRGWKYHGEFQEFMMHGAGELMVTDSANVLTVSKGTFLKHRLDLLKNYTKIKQENNLLHMEFNGGNHSYEGGVIVDADGHHVKHGSGTYDCEAYRYEGSWQNNKFHGRGKYVCKLKKPEYFPFEAGDLYEGEFNDAVAEGSDCRWEHHGKFRYTGVLRAGQPCAGEYESFRDHTKAGIEWKSGWKYSGELQDFKMHGAGKLTISDSTGVITILEGRFVNHVFDRTKDYKIYKCANNVVVQMVTKVGELTYDGDVAPGDTVGTYSKHGRGTLDSNNYRYEGDWYYDTRHGSGRLECKQTTAAYFPFEAGDLYEGEFNMRVAEGNCVRWERPGLFKYAGKMAGNYPVTGVYESFCDHTRGNGTEWKRGWKYHGEFQEFMMHGAGELTVTDSANVLTVSKGSFVNHVLDKTRDYMIYIFANNVVVQMDCSIANAKYIGDVKGQFGSRDYMKQGRGTYECEAYRYEGDWVSDKRHGHGKLECKLTVAEYQPFETGDVYEGEFNMRIPEGNCVHWTRPNVFIYRGTMSNGKKHTGVLSDLVTGATERYENGNRV